nr:uncharacterized protein LOC129388159 [Dermacentor andersoni]
MKALHTKVGKLPWKDVFGPAIHLAKKGFNIGPHLADALANNEKLLSVSPALRKRFSNSTTGAVLRKGEKLVQTQLAELLTKLAEKGPEYLYKKELADEIETNIKGAGGPLTKSDLSAYDPVWQDPVSFKMKGDQRLHSAPIPGAGVVLAIAVHRMNVTPNCWLIVVDLPPLNFTRMPVAMKLGLYLFNGSGVPRQVLADRRRTFSSRVVEDLLRSCSAKHKLSTAYHPQKNGLMERLNRTLTKMLSMYISDDHSEWHSTLPFVTFACNSSYFETAGFLPFYFLFGRHPSLPFDMLLPSSTNTPTEYVQDVFAWPRTARRIAGSRLTESQATNKFRLDSRH